MGKAGQAGFTSSESLGLSLVFSVALVASFSASETGGGGKVLLPMASSRSRSSSRSPSTVPSRMPTLINCSVQQGMDQYVGGEP